MVTAMGQPLRLADAPPASRRQRRVREVHDRIVAAAVECFEQRGIDATKVDDICAVADVAQKTFFNHFPTKQHLVREIVASFVHDLLEVLEDVRRSPGSTAVRLERFFAHTARHTETSGPMHRGLVMEMIRQVHEDRADVEQRRRLHAAFAALLRDGVRAGDVTGAYPVAVLSEVVVGAFTTLMLNWLAIDDYPVRARASAMARFLADALRVRDGAAEASAPERRASTRRRRRVDKIHD
jgi:AcrR family transcriptional regulator